MLKIAIILVFVSLCYAAEASEHPFQRRMMIGGYSGSQDVTDKARRILADSMAEIKQKIGLTSSSDPPAYKIQDYKTQLVNGINHKYSVTFDDMPKVTHDIVIHEPFKHDTDGVPTSILDLKSHIL
nr:stefin 2 [Enteromyxum scophthalmi]